MYKTGLSGDIVLGKDRRFVMRIVNCHAFGKCSNMETCTIISDKYIEDPRCEKILHT